MKKFALVITAFNEHTRPGRLERCAEIAMRDPRICELIIRDDSGDGTPGSAYFAHNIGQIIRPASWLRVVTCRNQTNLGVFGNKLAALRAASCEWVQSLDSDNWIDEAYVDHLCECDWDPHTMISPSFAQPEFDYRAMAGKTIDLSNVREFLRWPLAACLLNTGNQFFHRPTMEAVMSECAVQDFQMQQPDYFGIGSARRDLKWRKVYDSADSYFFNLRWLLAGNEIFIAPKLHYWHEVHPGSSWQAAPAEKDRLPDFYADELREAAERMTCPA